MTNGPDQPTDDALTQGFPPILGEAPRVLILGSLPSVASVKAGQYYGHPRNAFWPIMGSLFGFDARALYAERCAALIANGVAVWDVLQAAERPGSLDAAIRRDSERVNDFAALFASHPSLTHVFFNGSAAEQLFRRHVTAAGQGMTTIRLPSTSPAHASMTLAGKREAWAAVAAACAAPVAANKTSAQPSARAAD